MEEGREGMSYYKSGKEKEGYNESHREQFCSILREIRQSINSERAGQIRKAVPAR